MFYQSQDEAEDEDSRPTLTYQIAMRHRGQRQGRQQG